MGSSISPPMIELVNLKKSFAHCLALDGLNLSVAKGTIHGIVGENGAGKSTAMKILCGLYHPDSGDVRLDGKNVAFNDARDAAMAGIGIVHQHFMLGAPFSGLDNLILFQSQRPKSRLRSIAAMFSPLNRKKIAAAFDQIAREFGLKIDLLCPVEELPVGQQQKLELLKILAQGAEIIIFDEPTAMLTPQEVEHFFLELRRLRDSGKTVVLITHKLNEIKEITDEVTIIRHGRTISSHRTAAITIERMGDLMVGGVVVANPIQKGPVDTDQLILKVESLVSTSGRSKLNGLTLTVAKGEILGVAGVDGNGQDALINSILNPRMVETSSGSVFVDSKGIAGLWPGQIRRRGVGSLPEDRLRFGVIPGFSLLESFLLGQGDRPEFRLFWFFRLRRIREICALLLRQQDVRPPNPDATLDNLSGGNQQKFVVARELFQKPRILIAAHPTRGVDVLARAHIHNELIAHANGGAGILVLSTDLEELLAVCHRIVVIFNGTIVGEFSASEFDVSAIGRAMGGVSG